MNMKKQKIIEGFNKIENMTLIEIKEFLSILEVNTLIKIKYNNGSMFLMKKINNDSFENIIIGTKTTFSRNIEIDSCVNKIHLDINYNNKFKHIVISIKNNNLEISRTINTRYFEISYDN